MIANLTWAPASTIVRQASGSDNWPLTWADDGDLYTAYGDGWGFDPRVPDKLSLGFAKVSGDPPAFVGTNITPSNGEQVGDGRAGKKASGMLMVDGTLYMWVRNVYAGGAHCQLAWSTDHAQTWSWANWTFSEFGYCTFINYGKNYTGARDDFVYMVSHNGSSAYAAADSMVLTRVPKESIGDRAAYKFFQNLVGGGNPIWTSDISDRGAVFTHAGNSLRSGISYNAALGRYLWWQQNAITGMDTRFGGGFGIYDAPEPWGPWTTVYFTEDWDVGPGETASFPTKWMSPDGKTLYLAFSGDDNFSVRMATLSVNPKLADTSRLLR